MRVCHIFPTVLLHDGPTNVLLALLSQLESHGVKNTVISMREPPKGQKAEQAVRSLGANYLELGMKNNILDPTIVPSLVRWIRSNDVQIVQCNLFRANIYGTLAARIAGAARVICVAHNVERYMIEVDFASRAARAIERQTSRFASAYVAVSHAVGDAIRNLVLFQSNKVEVIPNGLDDLPQSLSRDEARARLGIDSAAFLVGSVGRLHPQKAYADLLTAIAQMRRDAPKLKLVVIGEGPEWEMLHSYRDKLGLQHIVSFVGSRNDVPDILTALDAFVMTSIYEGLPVALLEAMRSGIPAVVTDAGGMPEAVLDGVTGFVTKRGDAEAVAQSIERLAVDTRLRQAMATAARERFVTHFSARTMAQKYVGLYHSLLQQVDDHRSAISL